MVLSAELSAAVLFVDSCFDCSELKVKESVVVSVLVERRDVVRLSVGGDWGIGRRPVWVCPSSFCALGERPVVSVENLDASAVMEAAGYENPRDPAAKAASPPTEIALSLSSVGWACWW